MGWNILKNDLARGFVDLLFPPLCLGCGEYTDDADSVCSNCRERLESFDLPFCLTCSRQIPEGLTCPSCGADTVPMFAYGNYSPPLKDIVIHFKFKGITGPARLMADLLVRQFQSKIEQIDSTMLIPIPLYPTRESARGYNQANLFAQSLAEQLGWEVENGIISRTKKRKEQARLDHRHRGKNIRGVFELDKPSSVARNVVLVDDVVTSGLTVLEARRTLAEGRYKVVAVFSIAHHI